MQKPYRKILSVHDIVPNKIYMAGDHFVKINMTAEPGWLRGNVDAVYDHYNQAWCASCEDVYTTEKSISCSPELLIL